jgi:hypothetical protein
MNPSTAILGMSHVCMHVILKNNKTPDSVQVWVSNTSTPVLGMEHHGRLWNLAHHMS